jgi:hypothetical protein
VRILAAKRVTVGVDMITVSVSVRILATNLAAVEDVMVTVSLRVLGTPLIFITVDDMVTVSVTERALVANRVGVDEIVIVVVIVLILFRNRAMLSVMDTV